MRTRNKVLSSAAIVGVIGVLIAVATSAFFSDTTTNPGNFAATGTLSMSNSKDGLAIFTSPADGLMKPVADEATARAQGVMATGSVVITNTGTLPGVYSLSQSNVAGTMAGPERDAFVNLCLSVAPATDCGVYSGPFNIGAATIPLGTLAAGGGTATYNFEVWYQDSTVPQDAYQNTNVTADFQFEAR